jgi:hypothetical protein
VRETHYRLTHATHGILKTTFRSKNKNLIITNNCENIIRKWKNKIEMLEAINRQVVLLSSYSEFGAAFYQPTRRSAVQKVFDESSLWKNYHE